MDEQTDNSGLAGRACITHMDQHILPDDCELTVIMATAHVVFDNTLIKVRLSYLLRMVSGPRDPVTHGHLGWSSVTGSG